jgi:hypothetical protein
MKIAAAIEMLRSEPLMVHGKIDNESVRLAVLHGTSARMGHLRRTAQTSFATLQATLIHPVHVPGIDNLADLLTKVMGKVRLIYLLKKIFGLVPAEQRVTVLLAKAMDQNLYYMNEIYNHLNNCEQFGVAEIGDLRGQLSSCSCRILLFEDEEDRAN